MTCTLIFPRWVPLGWVHWAGTSQRERLYMIERVECAAPAVEPVRVRGWTWTLCAEHAAEMAEKESEAK